LTLRSYAAERIANSQGAKIIYFSPTLEAGTIFIQGNSPDRDQKCMRLGVVKLATVLSPQTVIPPALSEERPQ
jgi:hypothetical protein